MSLSIRRSFRCRRQKGLAKAELEMAKALVQNLATEWKPEKYTDEYRENLMRVIQAKAKGKKIKLDAPARAHRPRSWTSWNACASSLAGKPRRPRRARQRDPPQGEASARAKTEAAECGVGISEVPT